MDQIGDETKVEDTFRKALAEAFRNLDALADRVGAPLAFAATHVACAAIVNMPKDLYLEAVGKAWKDGQDILKQTPPDVKGASR